jgi:uncharacterized protein YdhG (YjbR/CyaY superfamily)
MEAKEAGPTTIDEYIAGFPDNVQERLRKIRQTIRKAAPAAEETIKYGIPTYVLDGNLVFFAAFQSHISVYPAPRGNKRFEAELSKYIAGKGTVQFPLDQPIPYDLITRIVEVRIEENSKKRAQKKRK